jgi:hypothetical protein
MKPEPETETGIRVGHPAEIHRRYPLFQGSHRTHMTRNEGTVSRQASYRSGNHGCCDMHSRLVDRMVQKEERIRQDSQGN